MTQVIDEQKSIDFYNNRPAVRTGGGVLIFNHAGELLLVKPTYRNTWSWPGGGSEPGESPYTAAVRECKEEIGITVSPLKPAFVNYIPPRPNGSLDVILFTFTTEPADDTFMSNVVLAKEEIEAAKFVPIADIADYMKAYRVRAIRSYLEHGVSGAMIYLEDGLIV